MGLMGMAPPHVEPGDLICVFFGARVPFILRSSGLFYTLIGEIYLGEGYMEGRAIEEMQAGTRFMESFEIR
jgi:hydrogenase/urease accessory protein HupE